MQFAINVSVCQLRNSLLSEGNKKRLKGESLILSTFLFKVFCLYGSFFYKLPDGKRLYFTIFVPTISHFSFINSSLLK